MPVPGVQLQMKCIKVFGLLATKYLSVQKLEMGCLKCEPGGSLAWNILLNEKDLRKYESIMLAIKI